MAAGPFSLAQCFGDLAVVGGRVEVAVATLRADDVAHRHDGDVEFLGDVCGLALAAAGQADRRDDCHCHSVVPRRA